ncbi:hypothetical protein PM082_003954 [Marasmius tenuissimus]|nr:hypothetical protein PM082_003954 [Marasmius tenuissimus]
MKEAQVTFYSKVTDVYAKLFTAIVTNDKLDGGVAHGKQGYFFVESDEIKFYELGEALSEALKDLGRLKGTSTELTPITKE